MSSRCVRWVVGGWTAFTLENVVLSENRTRIIEWLGEQRYHTAFSTLSTAATLSVAYGYLRYGPGRIMAPLPAPFRVLGAGLMVTGAALLSQLPMFQSSSSSSDKKCPINASGDPDRVHGIHRVTRHPMLYGVGLLGMGLAMRSSFAGRRALFAGPLGVSLIGTFHQDSRYRRGMGGALSPARDAATSNIPFVALVQGRQSWQDLWQEIDGQRLAIGVAVGFGLTGVSWGALLLKRV